MAEQAMVDDEGLMETSAPEAELEPEAEFEPEVDAEQEVTQEPEPEHTTVESEPSAPEASVNQQDELTRLREQLREKTAALKASNTAPVIPAAEPALTKPAQTADDINQTRDNAEAETRDIDDASSFDSADWPIPEISEEVQNHQPIETMAENLPNDIEGLMPDDAEVVTQQSDNEPTPEIEHSNVQLEAEAPIIGEEQPPEIEEFTPSVSADEPETTQATDPAVTVFDDALGAAADLAMAAMENEIPTTSDGEENQNESPAAPEANADQSAAADASAIDAPTSADDFAAALAAEQAQAEQERLETESQMANFEEVSQPPLPQPDELDDLMSEVNELQRQAPGNTDNAARLEAAAALPLPDNASLNKLMQEVRQLQQTAAFKPVTEKGQQDLQKILSHIPRFGGKHEGGDS